ncbi:hypothetical protein [Asticcacaulis machinosus]|uniref:Uncharacterized protein n=1 Tax=Asticcacaulis machinosus TaxID=2984211 RepID=A0ABT5HK61_9CAUL|nr:hypothetical protein [Asticcacaulis machinosus]MDC7676634.1 hypothetical protein [Asticcacaulis machinosus]
MKTSIKAFAIAAFACAGMAAASVPAMADSRYGYDRHDRYERQDYREDRRDHREDRIDYRLDQLDRQIDRGARYGNLSRREEYRLRSELRDLERLSHQFERSGRGIDGREMQILNRRTQDLSRAVAINARDYNGRRY